MTQTEIRAIAVEAAQETARIFMERSGEGCNPTRCREKCGLSPSEHFESHRKVNDLFASLDDVTRSVRSIVIKIAVTLIVGAAALGLGINIDRFLK